jgi:hypothetical protein
LKDRTAAMMYNNLILSFILLVSVTGCLESSEKIFSISGTWVVLSSPTPIDGAGFYSISETRFIALEVKDDSCFVDLAEAYTIDADSVRLKSSVFVYTPFAYRKSKFGDSLFLEYPLGRTVLGIAGSTFPDKCRILLDERG